MRHETGHSYRRTLARGIQSDFAIGRSVGDYAVGAIFAQSNRHDFDRPTGWDALAAVGLASTLYIVAYLLCMGILAAVPPLAAQAYGARKPRLMRRTIRQGLWISVMLGILSIGALWPAEQIFLLLGQTPDLAAVSQEYVRAAVWGIVPGLCVIAMRGFISVMDRPNFIFIVMLTGFTVNALADYAFIFGVWGFPKLGVMGSGSRPHSRISPCALQL